MKKKTRKFLIRKYAVTLLLAILCLLYIYLLDWLYGYGLGNVGYILNYLFYTASESNGFYFAALLVHPRYLLLEDRTSTRTWRGKMTSYRRNNDKNYRDQHHKEGENRI